MKTLTPRVSLLAAAALAVGSTGLSAQQGPLICSIVGGVECDGTLNCQPPLPDPPPPTFIHVDTDAGVITLLAPESRRGEHTQIGSVARQEGRTILTGAEAGRGWSMAIDDTDLHMTLTMTEPGTGFVVFGACMAEDQATP